MESLVAVLLVVGAVLGADRLLRRYFRQEGDRTVGARQRGPQTAWRRPTGEVVDDLTRTDAERERSDS